MIAEGGDHLRGHQGGGAGLLQSMAQAVLEILRQCAIDRQAHPHAAGERQELIGAQTLGEPSVTRQHDGPYGRLLDATGRVVGQAKRFSKEITTGVKHSMVPARQVVLEGHRQLLDEMLPRVQQVIRQTKARIFHGDSRSEGKIVSLFEPSAEVIRKGKASKPTEFGKLLKLQEAENQIVVDYEVFAQRPSDMDLLIPAIDVHQATLGRTPRLVAADAGFYSAKNEAAAKAKGVKRVCIPNRSSKSAARKREQKKRWFRNGQRWRTGCEGRISVSKRRHGLNRCRYRGDDGMQRWVGLGVIADNLINVGLAIGKQSAK